MTSTTNTTESRLEIRLAQLRRELEALGRRIEGIHDRAERGIATPHDYDLLSHSLLAEMQVEREIRTATAGLESAIAFQRGIG